MNSGQRSKNLYREFLRWPEFKFPPPHHRPRGGDGVEGRQVSFPFAAQTSFRTQPGIGR